MHVNDRRHFNMNEQDHFHAQLSQHGNSFITFGLGQLYIKMNAIQIKPMYVLVNTVTALFYHVWLTSIKCTSQDSYRSVLWEHASHMRIIVHAHFRLRVVQRTIVLCWCCLLRLSVDTIEFLCITKTCPCNIQQYFTAVKIIIFR